MGEVAECKNEVLRHNRPEHDDSQRRTYLKRNIRPIHEMVQILTETYSYVIFWTTIAAVHLVVLGVT